MLRRVRTRWEKYWAAGWIGQSLPYPSNTEEWATRLLGESPLLASTPSYWGGIDSERSHLLANLSSLLIRPTIGGQTLVGPTLSSERLADLAACITAMPWQWVGQELPQFSSAPTSHAGEFSAGPVGMRLFTVAQRGGYAPMLGGLGYVLAPGPSAYTLKTVAAKDVWVRPTERSRTEAVTLPAPETPAKAGAGTLGVSSPRVLSDLFQHQGLIKVNPGIQLIFVQHLLAARGRPVPLTAVGEGADRVQVRRQGDRETRRQGDRETRRQGESGKVPYYPISVSPCLLVIF